MGKMCHRDCCSGSTQEEKELRNKTSPIITQTELSGQTVGKSFFPQTMWKAGNTQHLECEL